MQLPPPSPRGSRLGSTHRVSPWAPRRVGFGPHSRPSPASPGSRPPPPRARRILPREARPPDPPSLRRSCPNPTSQRPGRGGCRHPGTQQFPSRGPWGLVSSKSSAWADSPGWRRAAIQSQISTLPSLAFTESVRLVEVGRDWPGGLHGHHLEGGQGATLPFFFLPEHSFLRS